MNKNMLNTALRIYKKSGDSTYKVKMMSFLFKKGKLITYSMNGNKTDPIQNKFGRISRIKTKFNCSEPFIDKLHAEISLLKNFMNEDCSSLTIFVLSLKADGTYRDSKPCNVCMEFLNNINIGEIAYIQNNRLISEKIL